MIEKINNIAEIVIPPAIATLRPKFHLTPVLQLFELYKNHNK
jgi:hypothetical protein